LSSISHSSNICSVTKLLSTFLNKFLSQTLIFKTFYQLFSSNEDDDVVDGGGGGGGRVGLSVL